MHVHKYLSMISVCEQLVTILVIQHHCCAQLLASKLPVCFEAWLVGKNYTKMEQQTLAKVWMIKNKLTALAEDIIRIPHLAKCPLPTFSNFIEASHSLFT
jgi:hypothetical protein